ncbi:hypothetical protein [Spirosoma sp.]|nr:hypothetical protein [Spirosoma sp.]
MPSSRRQAYPNNPAQRATITPEDLWGVNVPFAGEIDHRSLIA